MSAPAGSLYLRQLVALAGHRLAEARSRRVIWVIVLAMLAVFVTVPFLPSDETPEGRLRLTLSVALGATEIVALLVTLILGALALTAELETKTIYLLDSKPVPRWLQVAGAYLGLLVVVGLLLAAMGVFTWALARGTAWRERARWRAAAAAAPSATRLPEPDLEREILHSRVETTARREEFSGLAPDGTEHWRPVPPAALPDGTRSGKVVAVAPGTAYRWSFTVPESNTEPVLTFRLRLKAGMVLHFAAALEVLPPRAGGAPLRRELELAADRATDIPVPREYVAGNGEVLILVRNSGKFDEPTALRVMPGYSLCLAAATDSFALALAKTLFLIFCRMAFLGAVVVTATTGLSFPVAGLVGGVTAFGGYTIGFVSDVFTVAVRVSERMQPAEGGGTPLIEYFSRAVQQLLAVPLPDFDHYSATGLLTDGLQVPWSLLGAAALWLVVARGGACLLLGAFLYRRRELGN